MGKHFVTQLTNRGDTFDTKDEAIAAAKAKANHKDANGARFAVVHEEEVIEADPAADEVKS